MAVSTERLTAQLQNKLNDASTTYQEKLDVAKKVFISPILPILRKEEQVLSWILETLQDESLDMGVKIMCYDTLLYCFKSNRMKSFRREFRSSLVTELVQVLKCFEDFPEDLKNIIRKCCVEVLSTSYFQRLFMCDVMCGCKLVGQYLKSINNKEATENFITVLDHYCYISKMCILKEDLRYGFAKEIIIPLSSSLCHSPEEKAEAFEDKVLEVFQEVLLCDLQFITNLSEMYSLSVISEKTKDVKSLHKKMKQLPYKCDPSVVKNCYSLFFHSMILKYIDHPNYVYSVFNYLNHSLGILVCKTPSIQLIPIDNWSLENGYDVLIKFMDIMDKTNLAIKHSTAISFNNWFVNLVSGFCKLNYNKTCSNNFFLMIIRALEMVPENIETCIKYLTLVMLQVKGPDIKDSYIRLVKTIINGSCKISRLHKFLAFFVQSVKECLMDSCDENLTLEDVLPKEVIDALSQSMTQSLINPHVIYAFKCFIFHLKQACLPLASGDTSDVGLCLNMEIVSELIFLLLQAKNMASHSVSDYFKEKFKVNLNDFELFLKRFGVIFSETHEDSLIRPFFKLCRAYGATRLLFREYERREIIAPSELDREPSNLHYSHDYLSPKQWKIMVQLVENHEGCQAKHALFELLVQKSEAVLQVEEGYEGPSTQVARYLLSKADLPWLSDHLSVLAPLFQSPELIVLLKKIIDHLDQDHSSWISLLKNESFVENRQLVLGVANCLMLKASQGFLLEDGEDEPISYQVMSLLDLCNLLEFELSLLYRDDIELKKGIEDALTEIANLLNEKLVEEPQTVTKIPHISLFEAPARLPMHYFSVTSQCCVLLSSIALLYQLTPGTIRDHYMFNLLLKIMNGPNKLNKDLLGKLNPGILLKFIAVRGNKYPGQRKLMKRICLNSFQNKYVSKKLFKHLCSPTTEDLWVTALVVDSLTLYKKKYIGSAEDSGNPMERKSCLEHLISSIVPVLCSEKPSPKHLYSYAVVFRYIIAQRANNPDNCLPQLIPTLQDYIDFGFADYQIGFLLIESMIKHRHELHNKHFPTSLTTRALHLMKTELMKPEEPLVHLIVEVAKFEEFQEIVSTLLSETEIEMEKEVWDFNMRNLFYLWCYLASTITSSEKSACRDDALTVLVTKLPPILAPRWEAGKDYNIIPLVVEIISIIANNTSVTMRSVVLDGYLMLLQVVPLPLQDGQIVVRHLHYCLNAMFELFLFRTSLILDRLPPFMQLYRKYLAALAPVSTVSTPECYRRSAISLGAKLERLATTIRKKKKEISRICPYVIADILKLLVQYLMYQDMTFPYKHIIRQFLYDSDVHAIHFLRAALPLSHQEMFNIILNSYEYFNKFTGRI